MRAVSGRRTASTLSTATTPKRTTIARAGRVIGRCAVGGREVQRRLDVVACSVYSVFSLTRFGCSGRLDRRASERAVRVYLCVRRSAKELSEQGAGSTRPGARQ